MCCVYRLPQRTCPYGHAVHVVLQLKLEHSLEFLQQRIKERCPLQAKPQKSSVTNRLVSHFTPGDAYISTICINPYLTPLPLIKDNILQYNITTCNIT